MQDTIGRMLVAAVLTLAVPAARAAEISDVERQRLAAHLEMTAGWLLDEVSGLSPAQLAFRRAPGTWSILEVLDHLVVVGPIYWNDLQAAVKAGPSAAPSANRDADILWYGIDRTHRETAVKTENPAGRPGGLAAALAAYRDQHARLLAYVKTTKDDLRTRYVERQRSDAYQWALLISTHEQRHILQIREIKSDPAFPAR